MLKFDGGAARAPADRVLSQLRAALVPPRRRRDARAEHAGAAPRSSAACCGARCGRRRCASRRAAAPAARIAARRARARTCSPFSRSPAGVRAATREPRARNVVRPAMARTATAGDWRRRGATRASSLRASSSPSRRGTQPRGASLRERAEHAMGWYSRRASGARCFCARSPRSWPWSTRPRRSLSRLAWCLAERDCAHPSRVEVVRLLGVVLRADRTRAQNALLAGARGGRATSTASSAQLWACLLANGRRAEPNDHARNAAPRGRAPRCARRPHRVRAGALFGRSAASSGCRGHGGRRRGDDEPRRCRACRRVGRRATHALARPQRILRALRRVAARGTPGRADALRASRWFRSACALEPRAVSPAALGRDHSTDLHWRWRDYPARARA